MLYAEANTALLHYLSRNWHASCISLTSQRFESKWYHETDSSEQKDSQTSGLRQYAWNSANYIHTELRPHNSSCKSSAVFRASDAESSRDTQKSCRWASSMYACSEEHKVKQQHAQNTCSRAKQHYPSLGTNLCCCVLVQRLRDSWLDTMSMHFKAHVHLSAAPSAQVWHSSTLTFGTCVHICSQLRWENQGSWGLQITATLSPEVAGDIEHHDMTSKVYVSSSLVTYKVDVKWAVLCYLVRSAASSPQDQPSHGTQYCQDRSHSWCFDSSADR